VPLFELRFVAHLATPRLIASGQRSLVNDHERLFASPLDVR